MIKSLHLASQGSKALLISGLGLCLWILSLSVAYADLSYTNAGNIITCPNTGIFTARIVNCVQLALVQTVETSYPAIASFMQPILYATITLAVAIFGVQILTGAITIKRAKKEVVMLIFKIGFAIYFSAKLYTFAPAIFGVMEEMQTIVTNALNNIPAVGCSDSGSVSGNLVLWDRFDCMVGRIFGFGPSIGLAPTMALTAGLMGILGAALFSGSMGVMFFMTTITALVMVILMLARCVYSLLLAYSMVAFLLFIAPLMFPLILFKATKNYFDKWLSQLISVMLQPTILFAFLVFFLAVFDNMLFVGNQSLQSVLSLDFSQAWRDSEPLFTWHIQSDPEYYRQMYGVVAGKAVSTFAAGLNTMLESTLDVGGLFRVPKIDFGGEHVRKMQELVWVMASIMLLSYLMLTMMSYIPDIANSLMSSSSSVDAAGGKKLPFERTLVEAMDRIDHALEEDEEEEREKGLFGGGGFSGMVDSGVSFAQKIPSSIKRGAGL